jgi:hypothetical protein
MSALPSGGHGPAGERPNAGHRVRIVVCWVLIASLVIGAVLTVAGSPSLVPIAGLVVTLIGCNLAALTQVRYSKSSRQQETLSRQLGCLLLVKITLGTVLLAIAGGPEMADVLGLVIAAIITGAALVKIFRGRR